VSLSTATGALVCLFSVFTLDTTETAVANGDTRTLSLYHAHTRESIDATYRVNGQYDQAVLEKLNWFLRDWRRDEPTKMDPRLFDVVWEVYRTAGATEPVTVVSAYRSPETNAMLRRRSRAVAEHSQHILGRAMDTTMANMSMEKIREIGMRLQKGGVGYYAGANFVHLDVGSVRHWPRMSYDQLVRLFPDGKTVHIPSNGQPLARYEEARAEIEAGGGTYVPPSSTSKNFFAWLFGGGGKEEEEEDTGAAPRGAAPAPRRGRIQVASNTPRFEAPTSAPATSGEDAGRNFFVAEAARAERNAADATATVRPVAAPPAAPAAAPAPVAAAAQVPAVQVPAAQVLAAQVLAAPTPAAPAPAPAAAAPPRQPAAAVAEAIPDGTAPEANLPLPMPPRRPASLMAYADVPVPPARPEPRDALAHLVLASAEVRADADKPALARSEAARSELAKPELAKGESAKVDLRRDPIGNLITVTAPLTHAAGLPVIITDGTSNTKASPPPPSRVLAYAPAAQISGLRSAITKPTPLPPEPVSTKQSGASGTPIVSARLDRSNFRSMTASGSTADMTTQTVLGPSIAGIRQAARVSSDALSSRSTAGYAAHFARVASTLDARHFAGSALEPLPTGGGVLQFVNADVLLRRGQ